MIMKILVAIRKATYSMGIRILFPIGEATCRYGNENILSGKQPVGMGIKILCCQGGNL